jgi:DNA repair protein RadC
MPDNKENKKVNIHSGHRERMRTRFFRGGIDALEDHEILEFLLFYVHKVKDTNPLGHALIKKFKTLDGVFSASRDELCKVDGISDSGAALLMLIGSLYNRIRKSANTKKAVISNAESAGQYCMELLKDLPNERMMVVSLNSLREVLSADVVSDGTCNATSADIRKILEIAMLRKASGVLLCHNHIGDSPNPSVSDIGATNRIISVLEGINISVIDHVICSGDTYVSMSERGILDVRVDA